MSRLRSRVVARLGVLVALSTAAAFAAGVLVGLVVGSAPSGLDQETSETSTVTSSSSRTSETDPLVETNDVTPDAMAAINPVPPPECGAYWGAYVNPRIRAGEVDAAAKLSAIEQVEADIGRTFAVDHQFYRWDSFLDEFNVENYIEPTMGAGRIPFLSWKPVMADGTLISWVSITAGDHDELIKAKADTVQRLDGPVLVVFDHEADARVGQFSPGKANDSHVTDNAGSAAEFVAAWQHVHDVFAAEGVTNVSWAWLMTRQPFADGGEQATALYPGDDYVDWVGLDPYNFYRDENRWIEMETLMVEFTQWVDQETIDKPWMLGEWGSVEDPNQADRKAAWLTNSGDYFQSEPRLKAVVHFDSSPEFNWLYDTSPSSRQAFVDLSNEPHFSARC